MFFGIYSNQSRFDLLILFSCLIVVAPDMKRKIVKLSAKNSSFKISEKRSIISEKSEKDSFCDKK